MINRRHIKNDDRGLIDVLNEVGADNKGLRQTVRHYFVYGNEYRKVQKMNDQKILPSFSTTQTSNFTNVKIRKAPVIVPKMVKLYLRPF